MKNVDTNWVKISQKMFELTKLSTKKNDEHHFNFKSFIRVNTINGDRRLEIKMMRYFGGKKKRLVLRWFLNIC